MAIGRAREPEPMEMVPATSPVTVIAVLGPVTKGSKVLVNSEPLKLPLVVSKCWSLPSPPRSPFCTLATIEPPVICWMFVPKRMLTGEEVVPMAPAA